MSTTTNALAGTPLFDEQARSTARMQAFDRLRDKRYGGKSHMEKMHEAVLAVIKRHAPITVHRVAVLLRKQDHLVSGRVTELREMGYIEASGHEVNPETGRKNTLWKATA